MAQCPVCPGAHTEITHIVETVRDFMPSKLISQASTVVSDAYRKTQVDSVLRTTRKALGEITALVDNPVAFVAFYSPVLRSIQALLDPEDTLPIYRDIQESFDAIFTASPNAALKRYVRVATIAEKARVVASARVKTTAEADALRTELIDEIDEVMLEMPDDATYQALAGLKVATVAAIDELKKQADTTRTYQLAQSQNALAVAYRVYGDASRADELVERNDIQNPALVPGGTVLEVLS